MLVRIQQKNNKIIISDNEKNRILKIVSDPKLIVEIKSSFINHDVRKLESGKSLDWIVEDIYLNSLP